MPTSLLLLLMVVAVASGADGRGARVIAVPAEEHGYQTFASQVIADQTAWEAFAASIGDQRQWNDRAGFLAAITAQGPDYSRERLVLIRHTEGSGANRVAFSLGTVVGGTLTCRIARTIPESGTADMAYYCFVVVVDPAVIRQIEVHVDHVERPQVIAIGTP